MIPSMRTNPESKGMPLEGLKWLRTPFAQLLAVYFFWLLGGVLSGSLFEVYFFDLGLSIPQIFLASVLWFVSAPVLIGVCRKLRIRRYMLLGIGAGMLGVLALYLFPSGGAAYVFRFLLGLTNFLFWIPFNIEYYNFRKGNNAMLGTLYYSVIPALSLVVPALAGGIAATLGYSVLYAVALACNGIALALTWRYIREKEHAYDIVSSLRSISGLRSLIFLEGFAGTLIVSVTIDLVLLNFVHGPAEFGGFISLVTVFSIAASLLTSRFSDHQQKRRPYILLSAAAFGLSAILASQAPTIALFFAAFGLIGFFRTIFLPLPFALSVDNAKSLADTMIAREFMLGLGRLAGAVAGFVVLFYSNIQTVLLLEGVAMLAYVPLFENRKRKLRQQ